MHRFLPHLSTRTLIAVTAALLAAACAPPARVADVPAPAACAGTEVAVVRNESGAPLEVSIITGSATVPLGVAPVGRSEHTLPPRAAGRASFSLVSPSGEQVRLVRGQSQSPSSRVMLDLQCR